MCLLFPVYPSNDDMISPLPLTFLERTLRLKHAENKADKEDDGWTMFSVRHVEGDCRSK